MTVRLGTVNVHVDDPNDIQLVPDYGGAPALKFGGVVVSVLSGGVLGLRDRLLSLGAELNRAADWLDRTTVDAS